MLATLLAAALLCAVALLIGQALCSLCRGAPAWYGGAIGLAALIVVARVAVRLPGDATTAAVLVGLLALAAGALLARRGQLRVSREGAILAGLALLAACVPFLVAGRVGLLGVSFNNDTAQHLLWAEGLRDAHVAALAPSPGSYPLGPHAVAVTLAQATGLSLDATFTALLVALPVLTALAARSVLGDAAAGWRVAVSLLAGLAYLTASYYAEGAFKETIMAGLLLAFAVALQDLGEDGMRARSAALLAFPVAGMLYSYSYAGAVWPALTVALWLALDLLVRQRTSGWRGVRAQARALAPAAAVAVAALALLVVVELPTMVSFLRSATGAGSASGGGILSTDLGNLAGPIPVYEAFGIWLGPDFRYTPPNGPFNSGLFAALAVAATAYGGLWLLSRRRLALPAALGAAALVYLRSRHAGDSPYVTAKALVVAAPLVVLVAGGALARPLAALPRRSELNLARLAALALFVVLAGLSSLHALRGAQVEPTNHRDELSGLRSLLGRSPTLFLGHDDYYAWELRGVPAAQPAFAAPIPIALRPEKAWVYGQPFDFDTVTPGTLDRFAFVITPRTPDQSEAPPNFRLVRRTRSFAVWRRTGPTPARGTLPGEVGVPGALLDCTTPAGRALAARRGQARVMPPPVGNSGPPGPLLPGHSVRLPFRLPAGRWTLSVPYQGPQAVTVSVGALRATLPPNLDRPGPLWQLGELTVRDGEPLALTVSVGGRRPWPLRSPMHLAYVGNVVATRADVGRRTVPLSDACGSYVDWYRLGA